MAELAVIQEAFSQGASLRPHRMGVAGYSLDGDTLVQDFREELDVDGERTPVPSAVGRKRSDMILLNDGDLAYAKVRMDEDSLAFATKNIDRIADSLTRNIVLACAWDMTRDGEMAAHDYLRLAITAIPGEQNMSMLDLTLRHIEEAVRTFVSPATRLEALAKVGTHLLFLARAAAAASDAQNMLVRAAARMATTPEQFASIKALYTGEETLQGLDLDLDCRWTLLISMVRGGVGSEAEIAALEAEDGTMTGHQNAAAARAAVASADVKRAVFDAVMTDQSIPNDTRWAMVSGFWAQARTTPDMYVPFVGDYFDSLERVWEENTFHTAEDIVTLMFPSALAGYVEGVEVEAQGAAWLDAHPEASAALVRIIRERMDVARRQRAAQAADMREAMSH